MKKFLLCLFVVVCTCGVAEARQCGTYCEKPLRSAARDTVLVSGKAAKFTARSVKKAGVGVYRGGRWVASKVVGVVQLRPGLVIPKCR